MKFIRVVVSRYGGPEVLELREDELPVPGKGEVRVRVLAAGVGLPDVMAREGIHPETPPVPFTPGWDLVGVVDRLGESVTGLELDQVVAAMPISGAYAEYVCLPQNKFVPVPTGLDPAEAVSLVLNYVTAFQMLHRSAEVRPGQRALIHGASGGVGTALLQLGKLSELKMWGTCSARGAPDVATLGAVPIDYRQGDFVEQILRLSGDGVDVVFDPIGGDHMWRSRKALRRAGKVVAYGTTKSLRGDGLEANRTGRRNRMHGIPIFGLYILGGLLLPGRKRVIPYSIQWLMRLKPVQFRQDLATLLGLLKDQKISPVIAHRFPLAEARQAHELLAGGGVIGKIVLVAT